jgi:hypothetical protein
MISTLYFENIRVVKYHIIYILFPCVGGYLPEKIFALSYPRPHISFQLFELEKMITGVILK